MSPVLSDRGLELLYGATSTGGTILPDLATSQALSCVPTAVEISYDSCFYSNVANTFLYKSPLGRHHASNFLRNSALRCP